MLDLAPYHPAGLATGIPVGRLLRTTFDQNDRPIETYIVILPADRHVLLYDVSAE